MKYKYLLFDADNTLFNFDECEKQAFFDVFSSFAFQTDLADMYEQYHVINQKLWNDLEKGMIDRKSLKIKRFEILMEKYNISNEQDVFSISEKYLKSLSEQNVLYPESYDVIDDLSKRYGIYLITNGNTYVQHKRFDKSPISVFFDKMYISEEMCFQKPKKEFFDYVVSDIGDPDLSDYLVIGDSITSDIDGALSFGIDACYVDRMNVGTSGRAPKYVIHNLSNLRKII